MKKQTKQSETFKYNAEAVSYVCIFVVYNSVVCVLDDCWREAQTFGDQPSLESQWLGRRLMSVTTLC